MGQHMKIISGHIDEFDIQALVDSQLGWEEEKRIWKEIQKDAALLRQYNELVRQKKMLLLWWASENEVKPRKALSVEDLEALPA
jgi:hypothetical protein